MDHRVPDHDDGDRPEEAPSGPERRGIPRWNQLLDAVRAEPAVPERLEREVMRAVLERRLPARAGQTRSHRRLAAGLLVAASFGAVAVWLGRSDANTSDVSTGAPIERAGTGDSAVVVEFRLDAPDARRVVVTGSFNHWDGGVALHDPEGDGRWAVHIRLPPGVHQYLFLVDDVEWVADPRAEQVDDGYGRRNALVAVTRGRPGAM